MTSDELEIPESVLRAEQKVEVARIWIADGDQVAARVFGMTQGRGA